MRWSRALAVLRGAAAMLTLAALTAGIPIALFRLGGSPVPARPPSAHHILIMLLHRDSPGLFAGAVREFSWLAWLAFTVAVTAEAQAAVRGRRAPRLHLAGLQGAAGRLVAGASLAFASPAAAVVVAPPAIVATAGPAAPHVPGASTRADSQAFPPWESAASRVPNAARIVVVRPGDCLWTIAQRYLGAGDRYPEIARLNLGHDMGGGELLTDPSLILPGWHLRLPPGASGRAAPPDRSRPPGPSGPYRAAHDHAPGLGAPAGVPDGVARPQARGSASAPAGTSAGRHQGIEQAAFFTLGMLAGSAVASLERLRHRQRQYRGPGRRIPLPADEASVRVERKLRSAARFAPSDNLRDALIDLGAGLAATGDPLPPIVGVHLTGDAIEVLLSAPAAGTPPAPFTVAPAARHAMSWVAPFRGPRAHEPAPLPAPGEIGDLLPGLFTAGATDSGGYLLLDLEALEVTCCDGPDDLTDRFLVTAVTELAASRWSGWYELVLAGCDELDVLGRAERCGNLDAALNLLESRAAIVADRLRDDRSRSDVRARRLADPEDEDWGLTLLVSRTPPTPAQMSRLLELAGGPAGIAALVAGDTRAGDGKLAPARFRLAPDRQGPGDIMATVTLGDLGSRREITVWPQTLTVGEYESLAGIFATASLTADVGPATPPYRGDGVSWRRLSAAPVPPVAFEVAGDVSGQDAGPGFARAATGRAPGGPSADRAGQHQDDDSEHDYDHGRGQQHERERGRHRDLDNERRHGRYPDFHSDHDYHGDQSVGEGPADQRHRDQPDAGSPRRPGFNLEVRVLGPVEILGSAGVLQPKQAELMLALALKGPVGLSNSDLCGLLGPDADHPRPGDSVRQLIARTRRRLGPAPDGREYIVHLGGGIYVPHPAIQLDWDRFTSLAMRGRAEGDIGDLRAAVALVRGQPFAGCFHWWIEVALIEAIRAEVVDSAEMLARLELGAGDPRASRRAARAGLAAETAAEQLWRALMQAEHEAGNPAGVAAAWRGCLDAISEIAPGGEPHPDTARLYRQLISPMPADLA